MINAWIYGRYKVEFRLARKRCIKNSEKNCITMTTQTILLGLLRNWPRVPIKYMRFIRCSFLAQNNELTFSGGILEAVKSKDAADRTAPSDLLMSVALRLLWNVFKPVLSRNDFILDALFDTVRLIGINRNYCQAVCVTMN